MLLFISIFSTFFSNLDIEQELEQLSEVGGYGTDFIPKFNNSIQDKEYTNAFLSTKQQDSSTAEDYSPQKKKLYKVQPGDTLSEIAKKFNISVESIAGSTKIKTLDFIREGQILHIPPKDGFYYTINKGDRIATIASKYKIAVEDIIRENPHINLDMIEEGEEVFLLGAKPKNLIRGWLVPVVSRIVNSKYGWRVWPRKAFHKGIDLKAYYSPVRAAKHGVVTFAGRLGRYGKTVIIKHKKGYKSLYAHLSRIYVNKGARVIQGKIIGRSGNTGYSFGPHLHFEISRRGKHINPAHILRKLKYR